MMILLVLLGGGVSVGGLLCHATWTVWILAIVVLLVVRPVMAWIGLAGRREPAREKAVISFFGVRGLGSIYYLSYGLGRADFGAEDLLWSTMTLVILLSITLHGITVTPVMGRLYRHGPRGRPPAR